jgi:hypothetical protein
MHAVRPHVALVGLSPAGMRPPPGLLSIRAARAELEPSLLAQVHEVIDAIHESSKYTGAEERAVAILRPDGELVVELVRHRRGGWEPADTQRGYKRAQNAVTPRQRLLDLESPERISVASAFRSHRQDGGAEDSQPLSPFLVSNAALQGPIWPYVDPRRDAWISAVAGKAMISGGEGPRLTRGGRWFEPQPRPSRVGPANAGLSRTRDWNLWHIHTGSRRELAPLRRAT